jgi:hypothetical protein
MSLYEDVLQRIHVFVNVFTYHVRFVLRGQASPSVAARAEMTRWTAEMFGRSRPRTGRRQTQETSWST